MGDVRLKAPWFHGKKKGTHSKWPPNPTQPTQPSPTHPAQPCPTPHLSWLLRLRPAPPRPQAPVPASCVPRARWSWSWPRGGRWKDKSHHQNQPKQAKKSENDWKLFKSWFKTTHKITWVRVFLFGHEFFVRFLSPSQKRITFSAKLRQWWKTPSCPANSETRWQIFKAFLKMILLFFL